MKSRLIVLIVAVAAVLVAGHEWGWADASQTAAAAGGETVRADKKAETIASASMTRNGVRVTLIEVAQVTTFFGDPDSNERRGEPFTRGLRIVYMVEPVQDFGDALLTNGLARATRDGERYRTDDDYVAGGISSVESYKVRKHRHAGETPDTEHAEDARVITDFTRGVTIDDDTVDIEIQAGFGEAETFVFENVPL